jgi:hypothetical protein
MTTIRSILLMYDNAVKSIADLWQQYSSPMAWSKMYNE